MIKNMILLIFAIISFNSYSQDRADDFYKQAKQYDSLGNYKKAIELYTKTIKANPKFLNAYFNRGVILAAQKDYQEALNNFIDFNQLSPNDFEVEYLMAACYYYLGDKDISFELVNKSLNKNPIFFDALKLRGTLFLEKEKYSEGIEDFNKALSIQTTDNSIYYMTGFCYESLNEKTNALNYYYQAEKKGYNNDELFNNIGNILSQKESYEKALIYFAKAISINNQRAIYYYNQGVAYYSLNFKDSAIDSWKKAKKLGYNNFDEEIKKLIN